MTWGRPVVGPGYAGISMRSRLKTAAFATLASALWAIAPAHADSKSAPRFVLASSANPSPALVKSSTFSDWALDSTAFSMNANGVVSNGYYADSIGIAGLGQDASSLRSVSVSAAVAPGLAFDVSSWRSPTANPWNVASPFGRPLLAGSDLRSPYVGLGSTGLYVGATISLADSLKLHFGRASSNLGLVTDGYAPMPSDLLAYAGSNIARIETDTLSFDWSPNDWSVFGVTASRSREFGSVLGNVVAAPLADVTTAETMALGISARVGFGEGWVTTIAFNQGVTQLNLNQNGFAANFDSLRSQVVSLAVAKQGLFGDDSLGIAVSRPLQLNYSTNRTTGSVPKLYAPKTASAPESDIQLGYVTTFLDGALALQANAAYQVNANGDKGKDGVSVLSRAKIKF